MEALTHIRVTTDDENPSRVFSAYTRGDQWNGHECPFLTWPEAMRLTRFLEHQHSRDPHANEQDHLRWDEAEGAFFMWNPEHDPEGEFIPGWTPEGWSKPLFGIGSYRWTWRTVDAERIVVESGTEELERWIAHLQGLLTTPPACAYAENGFALCHLIGSDTDGDQVLERVDPYHTVTLDAQSWEDLGTVVNHLTDPQFAGGNTQAILIVRK